MSWWSRKQETLPPVSTDKPVIKESEFSPEVRQLLSSLRDSPNLWQTRRGKGQGYFDIAHRVSHLLIDCEGHVALLFLHNKERNEYQRCELGLNEAEKVTIRDAARVVRNALLRKQVSDALTTASIDDTARALAKATTDGDLQAGLALIDWWQENAAELRAGPTQPAGDGNG